MRTYQGWALTITVFSAGLFSSYLATDYREIPPLKPENMAYLTVDRVSVGENAMGVRRSLGNPDTVKAKDDYEIWLYPRCSVLLRFGKVVTVAGQSLFLNQSLILKPGSDARLAEGVLSKLGLDPGEMRPVPSSSAIFFAGPALDITHWMGRHRELLPLAIKVELVGNVVSRIQLGDNDGIPRKDGSSVRESLSNWNSIQNWVATNGDLQ